MSYRSFLKSAPLLQAPSTSITALSYLSFPFCSISLYFFYPTLRYPFSLISICPTPTPTSRHSPHLLPLLSPPFTPLNSSHRQKEHILTIAIALSHGINIYAFDPLELKGVHSMTLLHSRQVRTVSRIVECGVT